MSELEPELLAFIHVTPGPYPDVEDPCGHTFAQHAWDYEGAGKCDGKRSALYEWENAEDGPFNCNCARSPAAIEIEWLRAELKSASVPVLETPHEGMKGHAEVFVADDGERAIKWVSDALAAPVPAPRLEDLEKAFTMIENTHSYQRSLLARIAVSEAKVELNALLGPPVRTQPKGN